MASFAFLPRKLQGRVAAQGQARTNASKAHFPPGLILQLSLTLREGRADTQAWDGQVVTSWLEQLVPRSCHYVQIDQVEQGKVRREQADQLRAPLTLPQIQALVRASSARRAEQLKDRLLDNAQTELHCDSARILQGEEEAGYWRKVPLRVQNRAGKQATAVKVNGRRRGAASRKRRRAGDGT